MSDKHDVDVYICGLFDGEEEIVTQTAGCMQTLDDKIHILYDERFDGDIEQTRNHIIIDKSQVRVLKRGPVEVNMIFENGLTHNTLYNTQAGAVAVGIRTDALEVQTADTGVDINILYGLEFEGADPVTNRLRMHVRYKDDFIIT